MANHRESDLEPFSKFRPDRFFKDNGQWYFLTREGTTEGPFETVLEAKSRLEDYLKVMTSGLLPQDSELSIEPLDLDSPTQSRHSFAYH